MTTAPDPFQRANYFFIKADHQRWHRHQSKLHILRSQLGFNDTAPTRPQTCLGCQHYHGIAYGQSRATRTLLVCGFHASGWPEASPCPDWSPEP